MPEWPPAALKETPKTPKPREPAKGPSFDRLSAREVVKRLGMQEAEDVDVFLSHAGYNPEKTVDIMAIALSMSKEEAQDIVDRAPCLIVGPVTRTRAAKMKTILEGTGATVQVIESGQSPD
jgi:ribosomal protein L7/L12